ncbi:TPA: methionine adenosyltransferase [Candidatus Bathyarchaeota archaeon]|nr:methionine adenosyltransferase [Candidatus Bathyarchaeota archaeon]
MLTRKVVVEGLGYKTTEEQRIEIVERKGLGHPDYVADASAESVSLALCQYYKERFGYVFHHNVDKGIVVGGRAHPSFGGGQVDDPIYVMVAGRATTDVQTEEGTVAVPVGSLAVGAIRDLLRKTFRFLDVDRHVVIDYRIRRGSADLVRLFELGKRTPLANDTSFGVCFAPMTQTERLVLETERYLNSPGLKKGLPEVGEDIKVLAMRDGEHIHLTVSAAIISSLTPDLDHYLGVKEEIRDRVLDMASKMTEYSVDVDVNTADQPKEGVIYLTVTGTSAEAGDDGNTGRGNRVNGLITPCRFVSLEATAGKNPINHVGKIYNVLAKLVAEQIYEEVKGVREVYVKILSQIGKPIDEPLMTSVQLVTEKGLTVDALRADVEGIVDENVENVTKLTDRIIREDFTLF